MEGSQANLIGKDKGHLVKDIQEEQTSCYCCSEGTFITLVTVIIVVSLGVVGGLIGITYYCVAVNKELLKSPHPTEAAVGDNGQLSCPVWLNSSNMEIAGIVVGLVAVAAVVFYLTRRQRKQCIDIWMKQKQLPQYV